jgi:hypothetical protein
MGPDAEEFRLERWLNQEQQSYFNMYHPNQYAGHRPSEVLTGITRAVLLQLRRRISNLSREEGVLYKQNHPYVID